MTSLKRINIHRIKISSDERGGALIQVVIIGALLAVTAYLATQLMVNNDRQSLRMIFRNANLNSAMDLASFVNDRSKIQETSTVLNTRAGVPVDYP